MEQYFQPEIECASVEQIRAMQSEKLVRQVKHVYENVPYYRDLMDKKGVKPEDIKSIDDLHKLPFISKNDLREAYPYGFLAVDKKDVVRIQSTSGTTGKRVIAFYTQGDVDLWDECCARALVAAGGIGNVIDRLLDGAVTDMIDFHFFPVFNVADIAVCTGCGLAALYILALEPRGRKRRNGGYR